MLLFYGLKSLSHDTLSIFLSISIPSSSALSIFSMDEEGESEKKRVLLRRL